MRILILSDNFPPERDGGAERIAFNYFNGLKNFGHDVFVMTTTSSHHPEERSDEGSLNCFCHPRESGDPVDPNSNIFYLYWPQKYSKFKHYFGLYNPRANKIFKKILAEIKPDIVHAHNVHEILGLNLLKLAKKSGTKVFLTVHDCALFHYGKLIEFIPQIDKNQIDQNFNYKVNIWQQIKRYQKSFVPWRKTIIKYYLKYADKIFAVSLELKKALEQNGIKNIEVIHNGIDINKWQTTSEQIEKFKNDYQLQNKKIIFWGGRLETLKGGELLLDALELVAKQNSNFILMIVGKKDIAAEKFINSAQKKNISTTITDWLPKEQMPVAYGASDLVAVPSAYLDPFPTINLEAMAIAKPIIGTCLGGTPEIVQNEKTGYVINPYNKETFAEKIIALLDNPELSRRFGNAGFERVQNEFSLKKQLIITIKYYEQNYT